LSSEGIKPYYSDAEKKQEVEQMFDNIAHRYDFLNHFLTVGIDHLWRRKAISLLKPLAPKRILDVATGTADLAIASMRLDPEEVIGIDLSSEMLALGDKKIEKRGLGDKIVLQKGDSEALSFESNSFDAVTVSFGVRNFQNLEKGIAEINRVTKPGGKAVILEFSRPTMFPIKQVFNFYFKYILPGIGKLISKDSRAYTYLPESVALFPEGKAFLEVLKNNGFSQLEMYPQTFGICTIYTGIK